MKKELQKPRSFTLSDSYTEYAKYISPNDSSSDGIRMALDYYKANHPNTTQPVDYEVKEND